MYMYYSRYTNNLQESAVIKANTFHRQQSTNFNYLNFGTLSEPNGCLYSLSESSSKII